MYLYNLYIYIMCFEKVFKSRQHGSSSSSRSSSSRSRGILLFSTSFMTLHCTVIKVSLLVLIDLFVGFACKLKK